MATNEGDGVRVINKFNGDNFGLWKFKMQMILAEKDLWEIVRMAGPSSFIYAVL